MNKFSFIKVLLFALSAVFIAVSCDDDYDQLGSTVVDGDIHNGMHRYFGHVVAYDRPTGAVQTSGLDINLLGVYEHPIFGKTTGSYVTQLQLAASPTFTSNVVVDSVWLYVPYASQIDSTTVNEDNERVNNYSLNNVFGDSTAPWRLKLRKNDYYLRSGDPASGGNAAQYYYNDQKTTFDSYQTESLLVDAQGNVAPSVEIQGFSNKPVIRTAKYTDDDDKIQDVDAEVLAPGLFLYLDKDFFNRHIINAPLGKLQNNNVFAEYFRGISFTAEQIGNKSVIAIPKFTEGYIKVKYTQNDLNSKGELQYEADGTTIKRESLTLTLNMKGTHVNLLEIQQNETYLAAVGTSNTTEGDEKLYVKGGEGSMALLDILSEADIALLKSDSVLINEANLKFYVDEATMDKAEKPLRVYLYDVNNKRPLYDYYTDGTSYSNTFYNKSIHGGILRTDKSGTYYKIKITNHLSNIINLDSTNVKLGLVVTQDINTIANASLRTPFTENSATGPVQVQYTPISSVVHPFGTVLFGTNPAVPENQRLKLEIFYTKPE